MSIINQKAFNKIWKIHTQFIHRFALWIVIIFTLISAGAVYYASVNLGINSNTAEMFDSSLPFRYRQNQFNKTFPLNRRNLVIVLEARNPETTDSLTETLARRLRNNPRQFKSVYIPGGGHFFKKNQLLFLPKAQLDTLSTKLARSQVLFSLLSQNYSLRGFFAFIDQVLSMGNEHQVSRLNRMFGEIDHTITSRLNGNNFTMSWQRVMTSDTLAKNRNVRFIQVKPHFDYSRLLSAKPAMETAHKIVDKMKTETDASIRITGNVAMSYDELQNVMKGMIIAGILAFVLVGLTLWIGLRSFRLITSAILTLLIGLALTVGFSAFAVGQLNMISVAFAILYIGLGIDYAIHFTLKFNECLYDGDPPFRSLKTSFEDLSSPLLLSTISTALGFYAFAPTAFNGVSELGIIAGTGMFISLIATFTFLPALLSLLYRKNQQISPATLSAPYADQISSLQLKNASSLRRVSIGVGIVSVILLFKISFDYNPVNLRNPDTESVATMNELINAKIFTPWTVDILTKDSTKTVQQTQQLRKKEAVGQVTTLFSFIPSNQKQKLSLIHSLKPRYQNIPPVSKDSASYITRNQIKAIRNLKTQIGQYKKSKTPNMQNLEATLGQLLDTLSTMKPKQQKRLTEQLEAGFLKTFPATLQNLKHSLNAAPVTLATVPENIKQRWQSDQNSYRIEVSPAPGYDKNNKSRRAFASTILNFNPEATGNLITIMKSGDTVKYAFIEAMTYAFVVIAVLLIGYLRSFKYTLYVLLPITLAGIMTCAMMVLLGLHFNFANIIALPLLFGLGVDNGIHIVHQAKLSTINSEDMLRTSTARAIFFSALTTLFSFGNLAFSPHKGTASMGIILTFGLLFILFTTLIVLPTFFMKREQLNKA